MNKRHILASLALLGLPLLAYASCDDVKAKIDDKIKASGVSAYSLEVVPADQQEGEGKVVGQCEGNKKIIYTRGAANGSTSGGSTAPASSSSSGN